MPLFYHALCHPLHIFIHSTFIHDQTWILVLFLSSMQLFQTQLWWAKENNQQLLMKRITTFYMLQHAVSLYISLKTKVSEVSQQSDFFLLQICRSAEVCKIQGSWWSQQHELYHRSSLRKAVIYTDPGQAGRSYNSTGCKRISHEQRKRVQRKTVQYLTRACLNTYICKEAMEGRHLSLFCFG